MQNVYCPLCKEIDSVLAFNVDGYQLRMCNVCDLNFIHPYLQKEEQRNPLSLDKQLEGEQRSVQGYFKHIATYYNGVNSYLDIGCGCGELLKKAIEFSISVRNGVEEDKERADFAANYASCEVFSNGVFGFTGNKTFDLISLINVFSHIPDLDSFFRNLHQMLNEKGKVIIKTGLFKKGFIKNNLFDWQVPEHVHFIGDTTMHYIADHYGFNCVENMNIPLAEELITKDFLLSPGLSSFRNTLKKIIYYTPGACFVLRKIYTRYTKSKLYANIVILEKNNV